MRPYIFAQPNLDRNCLQRLSIWSSKFATGRLRACFCTKFQAKRKIVQMSKISFTWQYYGQVNRWCWGDVGTMFDCTPGTCMNRIKHNHYLVFNKTVAGDTDLSVLLYSRKQTWAKIRAHISGPWSWLQSVCLHHYTFSEKILHKLFFFKLVQTVFSRRPFGIPGCNRFNCQQAAAAHSPIDHKLLAGPSCHLTHLQIHYR